MELTLDDGVKEYLLVVPTDEASTAARLIQGSSGMQLYKNTDDRIF